MRSHKLVQNNQNAPYLSSNGHFQMTLFVQRVNIKTICSIHSIYVTYLFRHMDLTDIWLLVQEIQGPEIWEFGTKRDIPGTTYRANISKQLPDTDVQHARQGLGEGTMGFHNAKVICEGYSRTGTNDPTGPRTVRVRPASSPSSLVYLTSYNFLVTTWLHYGRIGCDRGNSKFQI